MLARRELGLLREAVRRRRVSSCGKFGQRWAKARAWWEGSDDRGSADRDIPGVVEELNEARRTLKAAIAERIGASADEQRRVASVLREAASAIRQKGSEPQADPEVDI